MAGIGKYFVECSRCHRMVGLILRKPMDELAKRTFTCSKCSFELSGGQVMADTKQATAETVCEHCGEPILKSGITPGRGKEKCWVHADGKRRPHIAAPRTQPSQTAELKIPDDLKKYYGNPSYEIAVFGDNDEVEVCGELCLDTLIERIARLEGSR